MSTDLGFPRPKIIKCTNHSIPCKNQWAVFWSPRVSTIVYGKILEKSHFPGDLPKAIQQIIEELNLQVQFTKVKAHSGVGYNEKADKLAKDGCDSDRIISISPKGIKAQKGYIMFNFDTIIDRNIRKTLKKPINFWSIK
ncbi:hypothetical protein RhiirC2_716139 [Rhizophagus irregularis]|uniref:RNase H type-1 domain-containing protein n=1 Tax=Rhizophagus irregularis TaxID=588596 RepID=A0A2N1MSR4_9GLOM|nr:hypothetical protein RhiirC2_716139 [Rhizophagus irregularis]